MHFQKTLITILNFILKGVLNLYAQFVDSGFLFAKKVMENIETRKKRKEWFNYPMFHTFSIVYFNAGTIHKIYDTKAHTSSKYEQR